MELTETKVKRLLDGLGGLKDDSSLERLMRLGLAQLRGKPDDGEALKEICASKPDVAKAALAGVTKLLVEAARHDTSPDDLNSLMQQTLSKSQVDKFCEFYANNKEQIQESLESVGNALPHIIDVDWQLDYCIKSSVNSPAGVAMYNVSFSTIKHGNIDHIKFSCTIQQLQDLVYKLKDAAKHTEKLTNQ